MNIQKKLSLNKHPDDCVPYSLVAAKNVKVSNDDRMIVNEEGLEDCKVIANAIHEDGINNFKIVGVIPTSTELILFIVNTDSNESYIYRYNEQADNCYRVNSNWKYNGGKIKGTYTYNVKIILQQLLLKVMLLLMFLLKLLILIQILTVLILKCLLFHK